jgi:hypothetical protein
MSYSIMIEIGNGTKCYFQYHQNIHILSQFSIILEKYLKDSNLPKL